MPGGLRVPNGRSVQQWLLRIALAFRELRGWRSAWRMLGVMRAQLGRRGLAIAVAGLACGTGAVGAAGLG